MITIVINMMSSYTLTAERARHVGLINAVVPAERLLGCHVKALAGVERAAQNAMCI